MNLRPDETLLQGQWLHHQGRTVADATAARIEQLVATRLEQLARDASGWCTLYRDPADGRCWELSYADSGQHGGGPPTLRCLGRQELDDRYPGVVTGE